MHPLFPPIDIAPAGADITSSPLGNKLVPAITVSLLFSDITPSGPFNILPPYPPPELPGIITSSPFGIAATTPPIKPPKAKTVPIAAGTPNPNGIDSE